MLNGNINVNDDNRTISNDDINTKAWRSNVAFGIIGTSFIGTVFLISPFVTMQLRSPLPYMATPREKVIAALRYIANKRMGNKEWQSGSTPSSGPTSSSSSSSALSSGLNCRGESMYGGNCKKSLRYYDLGSGDGETVLAASSKGWRATGIELNSTLWALSSFRRLLSPPDVRAKSNFIFGDMWSQSIHDADAVMIFGVKPLMPRIAKKVTNECRPGTFIMSYRFLIPCIESDGGNVDKRSSNSNKTSIVSAEQAKSDSGEDGDDGNNDDESSSALNATLVYDKDEMRIYELKS